MCGEVVKRLFSDAADRRSGYRDRTVEGRVGGRRAGSATGGTVMGAGRADQRERGPTDNVQNEHHLGYDGVPQPAR